MGKKRIPGIYKRHGVWHIDKHVDGRRLCESTGTDSLAEAERYLARRLEEIREARIYGVRPERTFRAATIRYLKENQQKVTLREDAYHIRILDRFLGDLLLHQVNMGSLTPFIAWRREQRVKSRTINYALEVTRRILNLAASIWVDENGLTWLASVPKITLLPRHDARKPYPLSWEEQARLFHVLPAHLKDMALFAVNTGCREAEICGLRWAWEMQVHEIAGKSVFIIPGRYVKNREDRLVILNDVAQALVNRLRGQHSDFVFTYRGKPVTSMNNTAWQRARKKVGIPVRVHDLKHSLGRRLRAVGVSMEDCQDLLGHKSYRITSHYTVAELGNLIVAANKVCEAQKSGRPITLLRVALTDVENRV